MGEALRGIHLRCHNDSNLGGNNFKLSKDKWSCRITRTSLHVMAIRYKTRKEKISMELPLRMWIYHLKSQLGFQKLSRIRFFIVEDRKSML